MLASIRYRMAHPSPKALHARLTRATFGSRSRRAGVCLYWWVIVPASFVFLPIGFLMAGLWCAGASVVAGTAWFIGRRPTWWTYPAYDRLGDGEVVFYGYKMRPNGTRRRLAPWEITAPFALFALGWLAAVYLPAAAQALADNKKEMWFFAVEAVAMLLWLGIIACHKYVLPYIGRKLKQSCPPMEWQTNEENG